MAWCVPAKKVPEVYVALNASGADVTFTLPEAPPGSVWRCLLDAAAPPPADCQPWVRCACAVFAFCVLRFAMRLRFAHAMRCDACMHPHP
jgi:hypothetical protein